MPWEIISTDFAAHIETNKIVLYFALIIEVSNFISQGLLTIINAMLSKKAQKKMQEKIVHAVEGLGQIPVLAAGRLLAGAQLQAVGRVDLHAVGLRQVRSRGLDFRLRFPGKGDGGKHAHDHHDCQEHRQEASDSFGH